jgi:hypothetical protein
LPSSSRIESALIVFMCCFFTSAMPDRQIHVTEI